MALWTKGYYPLGYWADGYWPDDYEPSVPTGIGAGLWEPVDPNYSTYAYGEYDPLDEGGGWWWMPESWKVSLGIQEAKKIIPVRVARARGSISFSGAARAGTFPVVKGAVSARLRILLAGGATAVVTATGEALGRVQAHVGAYTRAAVGFAGAGAGAYPQTVTGASRANTGVSGAAAASALFTLHGVADGEHDHFTDEEYQQFIMLVLGAEDAAEREEFDQMIAMVVMSEFDQDEAR